MVYASSKEALKRSLPGIAAELQANDPDDIEYESVIKTVSKGTAAHSVHVFSVIYATYDLGFVLACLLFGGFSFFTGENLQRNSCLSSLLALSLVFSRLAIY